MPRFGFIYLIVALAVPAYADEIRQKRIISDFEDAGTWRLIDSAGLAPGSWFVGNTWMGGSQNAKFADDWVGEIRFAFSDTAGAHRMAFRRVKMAQVNGFLDGIEFDADSRGHPALISFTLLDSAKKRHTTPAIKLGAAGWKHSRLELNANTWPSIKNVRFPACVEQVVVVSAAGDKGSIFIDDLTLTGTFSRKDRLSVVPVYTSLSYDPSKQVVLDYRVRSAMPDRSDLAGRLVVSTVGGEQVFVGSAKAAIGGYGKTLLRFAAPILPVGAYEARLEIDGGGLTAVYDDTFGVFRPNGARINRKPMWFGIQDLTMWQAEGENRLHLEWMKQIGFDLNRPGMTAGRFDPSNSFSLEAWRTMLQPFEDAGIDSSLLYFETPAALLDQRKDNRTPPTDLAAFGRYAAEIGRFFGTFEHIRYIEFWNEPDIGFFNGTLEDYLGMLDAFSRGVRSTAPRIKITTGGSTVKHPREKAGFNEALYSKNGDMYDVAAFHAHGALEGYIERELLVEGWQADGGLSKPIANTESGERSGYDARGRAEQAMTLVKKITYAKSRPQSEFHVWFTLQDYWDMDPDADDSFGLVTSDNRAKPSLIAYNELIRRLANTEPVAGPTLPAGVSGHTFRRDDGREVLVCWSSEGESTFWIRSAAPVTRVELYGRDAILDATASCVVAVGKAPVYLESTGKLEVLQANELPIEVPAEMYRDPKAEATFPVVVRNLTGKEGASSVTLRDPAGTVVWTDTRRLKLGEVSELAAKIPASVESSLTTIKFSVELAGDGVSPIILPITVHDSYVIAAGRSSVIALRTAQDVRELTFDPSIPAWRGAGDLSAEARVEREGDALVFHFDVTDDRHVQQHPDAELWRGDSVQAAFYNPANGAHTLFDLGLRGEDAVAWCRKNKDVSLQGRWALPVKVSIRRSGTHTLYEANVPLSYLGVVEAPTNAIPVRFSFLVNEDDSQGRVRWLHWRGGLGDNQDISQLGHAILK